MYRKKIEAPLLEGRARVVRLHPVEGLKERAEHYKNGNQKSTGACQLEVGKLGTGERVVTDL